MTEKQNRTCVYCGETEQAIRDFNIICIGTDAYTGEATVERSRHRFKPFSEQEQSLIESAEREAWGGW